MKSIANLTLLILMLLAATSTTVRAQQTEISEKFRRETIDSLLQLLKDKYAYPETASKMEAAIREKQARGAYDSIRSGEELAARITADLRTVFDDKHLKLKYSREPIAENSSKAGAPTEAEIERARQRQRRRNFGVEKVEILKGNVGLIQVNFFAPLDWASGALGSAMNLIADADALIIDVRENPGSMDINTIPFFSSYLFDKPVQIGDIYTRETGETRQLWTYAKVPGSKYLDRPVYVLTSRRTGSGAEAFVSAMKRLKRATLVGETTAGATLPGGSHRVNEHFSVWISTGRAASGSADAENKGIAPDIAVAPDKALKTAQLEAIKQISRTSTDDQWKSDLKTVAGEIEGGN